MFANIEDIQALFGQLPCPIDISFKYSVGHMYSITNPKFIKGLLPALGPKLRSWLTLRNDDIHSFRWADVDYARDFIKNIPGEDKIAGFYMGPDGYHWGRDFITKNPDGQRQTIIQKMWHSFALWGRLAYDPDLPAATFERLTAARFPGADASRLTAAWADASKTFPYITRFFWGDIDIKWFPEACWSHPRRKGNDGGFYTVQQFMEGSAMPGAKVLCIRDWLKRLLSREPMLETTPLQIADDLEAAAEQAFAALDSLLEAAKADSELQKNVHDCEALAWLGRYYAAKIRGACALALFDASSDRFEHAAALRHLNEALSHWKHYAAVRDANYVPALYNRLGYVDITAITEQVAADIAIAKAWKPGSLKDSGKRAGAEKGFRK